MPLSPIATLVHLSGEPAFIRTFPPAAPYDPDAPVTGVAPAHQDTPIRGVYAKTQKAGETPKYGAMLLTTILVLPAGFNTQDSQCLVKGVPYAIAEANLRNYIGRPDGYTFQLRL